MENFEFTHGGKSTDMVTTSIADIRDLVQAFAIPNEAERVAEINLILSHIVHKSKLPAHSLRVVKSPDLTGSKFGSKI